MPFHTKAKKKAARNKPDPSKRPTPANVSKAFTAALGFGKKKKKKVAKKK